MVEKWPGLTLDLERTAVFGESAGGYLSLQSALLFPSAAIKVVMAQYCALYPDIAAWNTPPDEVPLSADAFINAYIAQIKPGTIRLSSPFPALGDLGQAMRQTGRRREWLGDDERLTLDYGLRTAEKVPPLWIMQGIDDQMVSLTFPDERHGHGEKLTHCLVGAQNGYRRAGGSGPRDSPRDAAFVQYSTGWSRIRHSSWVG